MKVKLLAALSLLLGVVTLLPAKAGAVPATLLAANYTEQTVTVPGGGCTVKVKHGPFSTASVSQMVHQTTGGGCLTSSYVENVGFDLITAEFKVQRCYIGTGLGDTGPGFCGRTAAGSDTVYQAHMGSSSLVGTKLRLCKTGACSDHQFGPSVTLADPGHFVDQELRDVFDEEPENDCVVNLNHGNFGSVGLARIDQTSDPGTCGNDQSYVEITAVNTNTAEVQTQRCYMTGSGSGDGSCSTYSGWIQAYIPDSYTLASVVALCGDNIEVCGEPQFNPAF
jgi:hypothetical protein